MTNQTVSADYLGTNETKTLSPRSDAGDAVGVSTDSDGLDSPESNL